MTKIHPSAIIDPGAIIGQDVEIGPYCIVGPNCEIGDGTKLLSHVVVESHTKIGRHCTVSSGAVLGGLPQDHSFAGETSWVEIGDHCQIRECVTVNRASGEDQVTKMGSHCLIMAYTHLGHNCQLGDHVILANSVQLGGFVEIGDGAFLGGICAVHQFVKIGRMTIVSGFSGTRQDLPPFATTEGRPQAMVVGINRVGLKRAGFSADERNRLKKAFQLLFFSKVALPMAIENVKEQVELDANVLELLDFVQHSKRGIHRLNDTLESEERSTSAVG